MSRLRNKPEIFLNHLDQIISRYSREDRIQMIRDYSELECYGAMGNTLLRQVAAEACRVMTKGVTRFDAAYISLCATAAYKSLALEVLAGPSLDAHDREVRSQELIGRLAGLPDASDEELRLLQAEARELMGVAEPEELPSP